MTDAVPGRLVKEQRAILDWVGAFVLANDRGPSYREIADGIGYAHRSTAQHHMSSLRRLGWLRWISGRSNTLEFYHPDGTWHPTPPPKTL